MFLNGGTFINIILNVDFVSSHVLLVPFPDKYSKLPQKATAIFTKAIVATWFGPDLNRDKYWTVVFALTFIKID